MTNSQDSADDRIELEPAPEVTDIRADVRRRLPEPPEVRVEAIADLQLWTPIKLLPEVDRLMIGILGFFAGEKPGHYIAENADLVYLIANERPPEEHGQEMRATGIRVPDLMVVRDKLIEAEIHFEVVQSLQLGDKRIALTDPAGNLLHVIERRRVG